MNDNKKGNIVIFNREKRSALQNSTFIEDIYSNSDDEIDDENVSGWERLEETLPNELSTLVNFTISNCNDTVDYDDIDDNELTNGSYAVGALADDSVIVIDD